MHETRDALMSTRSQQEAMLVLADAIDNLLSRVADLELTPVPAATEWADGWVQTARPSELQDRVDLGETAKLLDLQAKLRDARDSEDGRALEAQIRLLKEQGASLVDATPQGRQEQVTVTDTEILIETPSPSVERAAARAKWAEGKELHTFFPMWKDDAEGFVRVYVKGGPLWMYHGDRDAILQMPYEWRRDLVEDIMHDSPATAQEVGRDILKVQTEQQRDYVESLGA